jgi:hypothetical protein
MKSLFIILFLFFSFSAVSQSDELVGTWNYLEVYEKETVKEKDLNSANFLFGDLVFYLKKDGRYITVAIGKVEEGMWTFDAVNKELVLTSVSGKKHEVEVIDIKPETLIIRFQKESLVLQRKK